MDSVPALTLPTVDRTVDVQNSAEDVKAIVSALCGDVHPSSSELVVEEMSGGIINRMFKVHAANAGVAQQSETAVIVRVNLNLANFNKLFNRKKEFHLLEFLSSHGLFGKLYGYFNNGVCYQFEPGEALSHVTVREPLIARERLPVSLEHLITDEPEPQVQARVPLACRSPSGAAPCHDISALPGNCSSPLDIVEVSRAFFSRMPFQYADPAARDLSFKLFPDLEEIKQEFEDLVGHPDMQGLTEDQPVVICHHDLLPVNIIFDRKTEKVSIIDYEFQSWGHQAMDVGEYFSEFMTMDPHIMDFKLLPDENFCLEWIRRYLETWNEFVENGRGVSDNEVWNFYVRAWKYSLLSDWYVVLFNWTIAEHIPDYHAHSNRVGCSSIDFARKKLDIYYRKKKAYLSLEMRPLS